MSYPLHYHHHCFSAGFSEYTISSCGVPDVTWIWICFQYAVLDIFLEFPQTMLNFWHSSILLRQKIFKFQGKCSTLRGPGVLLFFKISLRAVESLSKMELWKTIFLFAQKTFGEFSSQYYKYIDIMIINHSCALSKIEQLAMIYCNSWNFVL